MTQKTHYTEPCSTPRRMVRPAQVVVLALLVQATIFLFFLMLDAAAAHIRNAIDVRAEQCTEAFGILMFVLTCFVLAQQITFTAFFSFVLGVAAAAAVIVVETTFCSLIVAPPLAMFLLLGGGLISVALGRLLNWHAERSRP